MADLLIRYNTSATYTIPKRAVHFIDGTTPDVTLTKATVDTLSLIDADQAINDLTAGGNALTHLQDGDYSVGILNTNVDVYGPATLSIVDASKIMPITVSCDIISQNYWDSLHGADTLEVDVIEMGGRLHLPIIQATSVSVADTTSSFPVGAGEATAGAYIGHNIVVRDDDDLRAETRTIIAWTAERVVTVDVPFSFTPAAPNDRVEIMYNYESPVYQIVNHETYGNAQLVRSTTPANALDVSATGEAGLDFDNIKDATGAHTLTNITIPTTTTLTNTAAIVTALKVSTSWTAAGAVSYQTMMKMIYAMARGKIAKSGNDFLFYDDDDSTLLFTLTTAATARTTS